MTDAICDAAEAADADDDIILPEDVGERWGQMQEIEQAMMQFAAHLKYPLARPDKQGKHAVLLMNYLPDLPDTLAYHFGRLGWRWHPEKAIVKQRPIAGGLFDDLVAYVDVNEPDDPIIVQHDDGVDTVPPPDLSALPWSHPPEVNIIDEERPPE